MRRVTKLSLAVAVSAVAAGWVNLDSAKAADIPGPQGQFQEPPPGNYAPPPVEESYAYPPPPAYGYPPPPVAYYAYAEPPVVVLPDVYYGRRPYLRGYGPHFARGYGHWDRGYRRW
jgi:hypothetical protein